MKTFSLCASISYCWHNEHLEIWDRAHREAVWHYRFDWGENLGVEIPLVSTSNTETTNAFVLHYAADTLLMFVDRLVTPSSECIYFS